jgi:ArsR family transcriptional regulator
VFKALAHPTRIFIVDELSRKRRNVYDLTKLIGADTSTISKHLKVLKDSGILSFEKERNSVYYKLEMKCVMGFFSCVENVLGEVAEQQLTLLKKQK